jgi:enamine deaminase RidA (YjgF/YER057c/UK114 family)
MSLELDRRELLKKIAHGGVLVGASHSVLPAMSAWAQSTPRPATRGRVDVVRSPLSNGIVVHAGATSMELYHEHPHLQREEIVQPDDIRLQTRLVMRNHKEMLDWLGLDWRNVVKLTCYLTRINESKQVHDVLASYFQDWRPAITTVEINGLSSPQARLEIDGWVRPDTRIVARGTDSVQGREEIFPRPEVTNRVAYALAVKVGPEMDLIFFSGITGYPFEVDPWNPGTFRLPADPKSQGKIATDNIDSILTAAGMTPQHILLGATYTAEAGSGPSFGARSGNWRSPGTALQVKDTGVPGAKSLRRMTGVAPRKTQTFKGPVPGIEPILPRPDMVLRNMPAAPAIRVSSRVALVFFSGVTVYPPDVDPWNPGSFTAPQDVDAQEKMLLDILDAALKAAGITWQHVILIERVGESASPSYLHQKLGDWRPCRVTRAVSTGIPGAKVMYEITAVAP